MHFEQHTNHLVVFCCRVRVCLFAGVRCCLVVRVLSEVVGIVVDRLYKPFARKPWLAVYRAHTRLEQECWSMGLDLKTGLLGHPKA